MGTAEKRRQQFPILTLSLSRPLVADADGGASLAFRNIPTTVGGPSTPELCEQVAIEASDMHMECSPSLERTGTADSGVPPTRAVAVLTRRAS
jgi:hypothetical protein